MITRLFGIVTGLAVLVLLASCGAQAPAADTGSAPAATTTSSEAAPATAASGDQAATEPASTDSQPAQQNFKLAGIFPGPVNDADYNTLGYNGIKALEAQGFEVVYSENVAVPDVERVMEEYINDGANIIFTHGSQFVNQTQSMASQYPDVIFIAENDAPIEDAPDNLWVIDRNFHIGFYPVGALAAQLTESNKVGYVSGLTLPFTYAEIHAMEQAFEASGKPVELSTAYAGNFNDPTKARELAEAMIADGADVIVGSLNLGMLGIFEAVKGTPVRVIAKYTDKSSFAPDNYVTSLLYDFEKPMAEIAAQIAEGQTGGYYPLGFDTGVALQTPLLNAPDDVAQATEKVVEDVKSGAIEVQKNTEPVE